MHTDPTDPVTALCVFCGSMDRPKKSGNSPKYLVDASQKKKPSPPFLFIRELRFNLRRSARDLKRGPENWQNRKAMTQHQSSILDIFRAPKISPETWVQSLDCRVMNVNQNWRTGERSSKRGDRLPSIGPIKKCARGRRPFSQWYHARKGVCLG